MNLQKQLDVIAVQLRIVNCIISEQITVNIPIDNKCNWSINDELIINIKQYKHPLNILFIFNEL